MDEVRIRSNTGRIATLEQDVAALEAGVTPVPVTGDLNMNNHSVINQASTTLVHTDDPGTTSALTVTGGVLKVDSGAVVVEPLPQALACNNQALNGVGSLLLNDNSGKIWFKDGSNNSKALDVTAGGVLQYDGNDVIQDVSGLVANPMTSNLAAGNHNISGVDSLTASTLSASTVNATTGTFGGTVSANTLSSNSVGCNSLTSATISAVSTLGVDVIDVEDEVTFQASASTNGLSMNGSNQLLWRGQLIGHESASGVHNPVQSDINVNSHSLTNVDKLGFENADTGNSDFASNQINGGSVSSIDFLTVDSQSVYLRAGTGSTTHFAAVVRTQGLELTQPTSLVANQGPLGITSRTSANDIGYIDMSGTSSNMSMLINGVPLVSVDPSGETHSLTNMKQIGFSTTGIALTDAVANGEAELLWGGVTPVATVNPPKLQKQLASLQWTQNGNPFATSITGWGSADYYPISMCNYVTPQGKYTYQLSYNLQLADPANSTPENPIPAFHGETFDFFLLATSSQVSLDASVTYPNLTPLSPYLIAKWTSADLQYVPSDRSFGGNVMITPDAGTTGQSVTCYGWNDTLLAGKPYLYISAQATSTLLPDSEFVLTGGVGYLTATFTTQGVSLQEPQSGQHLGLSADASGNLLVGSAVALTNQVHTVTTTDNTQTTVATIPVSSATAGLLVGSVFSQDSAFRFETFAKNDGGTTTVAGTQVHEYANPNSHALTVVASDSSDTVDVKVTGPNSGVNWKVRYNFDSVPFYVAPDPDPLAANRQFNAALIANLLDSQNNDTGTANGTTSLTGTGLEITDTSATNYVAFNTVVNFVESDKICVSYWAKFPTGHTGGNVVSNLSSDFNDGWGVVHLNYESEFFIALYWRSASGHKYWQCNANVLTPDNDYHHVVVNWDDAQSGTAKVEIWIDGTEYGTLYYTSGSIPSVTSTYNGKFYLGRLLHTWDNVEIKDVRVYKGVNASSANVTALGNL